MWPAPPGKGGYARAWRGEAGSLLHDHALWLVGKGGDVFPPAAASEAHMRSMTGPRNTSGPVATNDGRVQVAVHVAFSPAQHANSTIATQRGGAEGIRHVGDRTPLQTPAWIRDRDGQVLYLWPYDARFHNQRHVWRDGVLS